MAVTCGQTCRPSPQVRLPRRAFVFLPATLYEIHNHQYGRWAHGGSLGNENSHAIGVIPVEEDKLDEIRTGPHYGLLSEEDVHHGPYAYIACLDRFIDGEGVVLHGNPSAKAVNLFRLDGLQAIATANVETPFTKAGLPWFLRLLHPSIQDKRTRFWINGVDAWHGQLQPGCSEKGLG